MNVLVVSGIWPPDVGGPATHAPEAVEGLRDRGHHVEVVTTATAAPAPRDYPVHWVTRSLPPGARHAAVALEIARRARRADVVYATSMLGRSAAGASLARRPLVAKVAGDAGFERSRRRGLYDGTLAEFQSASLPPAAAALRRARTLAVSRAARVVCPSEFLRSIVVGWGIPAERVSVLPNATPPLPELPPRDELRHRFGVDGPTLAFAGRLTAAKELETALAALAELDGVTLLVAGDGEERARLESLASARTRFLGSLPRDGVLELFRAADAAILTSAWENFPHTLVEALAVGTPVVATAVGGVPEIVEDGRNGLLVPRGDAMAFAAAVRRLLDDDALRARLGEAAAPSVERFSPSRVLDLLEAVLRGAAG